MIQKRVEGTWFKRTDSHRYKWKKDIDEVGEMSVSGMFHNEGCCKLY